MVEGFVIDMALNVDVVHFDLFFLVVGEALSIDGDCSGSGVSVVVDGGFVDQFFALGFLGECFYLDGDL